MAIIQTGSSTTGNQNVDTDFNGQVNLPYTTPAGVAQGGGQMTAGFATMLSERDSGSLTGTRDVYAPEVTTNFRLRVGTDQTMFNEIFVGTVLNSSLWTAPVATSTISVASNQLVLNNGASLVSGAVARVTSYASFPVLCTYPLFVTQQILFTAIPVANMVHEWGVFISTGTAAATDGAYFTINAVGEFRCVVNTNGNINQSSILDFNTLIGVNSVKSFLIYIGVDSVTFWINNIKVYESSLFSVSALGLQIGSGQLPVSFRSYNTATVTGTACLMKVAAVNVTLAEMSNSKPWSHIQAGAGAVAYQGQTGQVTLGTLALYSNNLASGTGFALTNTTAAAGSGLAGQFSVQPTLAIGTDGVLQSYQIPIGSAILPGRKLYITALRFQGAVTTALTGGNVLYTYSLAYGHNAVSLATTTSTTSKAPVRVPLGIMDNYVAAATVGVLGQAGFMDFSSAPIVLFPGEFIQLVVKNLGVVTTAGVITYNVMYTGYWE